MKFLATVVVAALFLFDASPDLEARSRRVDQVPNGSRFDCNTCHTNGGGSSRNEFGIATFSFTSPPNAAGSVGWVRELAMMDSDGDGFTNGEELQDPFGEWREGDAQPGTGDFVGNPGSFFSVPSGPGNSVRVDIKGFGGLVGRFMQMRLVDISTGMEVWSTTRDAVPGDEFRVAMLGAVDGASYFVDFYVDGNDNQAYDPPTTDEAWRIRLDNVNGGSTLDFTYNTDYTDINWGEIVSVHDRTVASGIELFGNTPNPVNNVTNFNFTLEQAQNVTIEVLGARGEQLATVVNAQAFGPGEHRLEWSATALAPGMYFYRLRAGESVLVRQMLVIR